MINECKTIKFEINSNKEEVEEMMQALESNDWYCPCALEKNDDTKCQCKYFREEVQIGDWCHCGLYKKLGDE